MKKLLDVFYNPPKGGNERGVHTASSMSALPVSNPDPSKPSTAKGGQGYQTSLRATMEAGVQLSREAKLGSAAVDQPEFRNYDRGYIETQLVDDPSGLTIYDYESNASGGTHGIVGKHMDPAPEGPNRRVTPVLNPNTKIGYRTDGKPE